MSAARTVAIWLTAGAVVLADQLTKQWALASLEVNVKEPLVGDFLSLQLTFNSGAAFSLGDSFTWVLTILSLIITAGIIAYSRRAVSTPVAVLFGVALGGAIGNLIDRLFREPSFGQGHVVDMINYFDLFIGNVADIAIVGAAIVLAFMYLVGRPLVTRAEDSEAPASDGAGADD